MPTPAAVRLRPWLSAFLLIGPAAATAQGPARRVRDIAPQPATCSAGSNPQSAVTLGAAVLFGITSGYGGIWRTDGTAGGTIALRDPELVRYATRPASLGSVVLFASLLGPSGNEMWRSDGTPAGTFLLRDINPGPGNGLDQSDAPPVVLGGLALFAADDGMNLRQLWRSDGSSAGTVPVVGMPPGAYIPTQSAFGQAGNLAFFPVQGPTGLELWRSDGATSGYLATLRYGFAPLGEVQGVLLFTTDDAQAGLEIWRSDGTAAGTHLLRDIRPGTAASFPSPVASLGSAFLFSAEDGTHGTELWRTDGTTSGTYLLRDINPGSSGSFPRGLAALGTGFLLWADDGTHGSELWRTDGTTAGTTMVADIATGAAGANPYTQPQPDFAVLGNRLLFAANDLAEGNELWTTDGTTAGTQRVTIIRPGATDARIGRLRADGAHMWFVADDGRSGLELWRTDGTASGTALVKDIYAGAADSRPQGEVVLNGVLLFSADDGVHGRELWRSDGTAAGTYLVQDLATCGTGSYPNALLADPRGTSAVYFAADDGVFGFEPWRSDGTAAGTVLVSDLLPGPGGSNPTAFFVVGELTMFASPFQLWRTDGTGAGTVQVPCPCVPNSALASLGGQLWFVGTTVAEGVEPWRTDGTAAGTVLVKDINPGNGWSGPLFPFAWRGTLWFSADDGIHGRELWRSDGSPAGTQLVADVEPGLSSSFPKGLIAAGDVLFFAASSGGTGEELWRTDGTAAGTRRVLDIYPGAGNSFPNTPAVVGTTLFFAADDGVHGSELWRSDGTAAGTVLVKDIQPGASGSAPRLLSALGNQLLFAADDGVHGLELWRSDGTAAGTVLVVDLLPGSGGGLQDSQILAPPGAARAVFFGTDGTTGREPWVTDGTAAGTRPEGIVPGGQSSYPLSLTRAGSNLFFVADDGVTGYELWAMRAMALAAPYGDNCGTTRFPRIAGSGGAPALGNSSFAVRVDGAPVSAPAGLFFGSRRVEAQLGGVCALAVDGLFLWILTLTDGSGAAAIALPVPNDPSLIGGRLFAQWAVAEAGGPLFGQGTLSSGLEIVVSDG